eukprot:CAMPEP_0113685048 /NCGR_PEP_ID=MMETSP0038_2-20120614/14410_1 /TAXON_ID=2898 /ORGANISM="Cryptomonas paramecium" /LENGTH=349 /DNA_ID=CAMNT_0000605001 /DNA_START=29 /DNA_END=1075 /DNA_ORIENTATION=- /assembly_acc=CAM_ASM_000170
MKRAMALLLMTCLEAASALTISSCSSAPAVNLTMLPRIQSCSTNADCCSGLSCVSQICVKTTAIGGTLLKSWYEAPNNVYQLFFLWDDQCNPFSVPASSLEGSISISEHRSNETAFKNISKKDSFYGISTGIVQFSARALLLVDLSGSVAHQIPALKNAISAFVSTVLKTGSNFTKIAIYGFFGSPDLYPISDGFSSDYRTILAAINTSAMKCDNCTRNLYGAVVKGLKKFSDAPATTAPTFDYMITFTDGADHAGRVSQADALSAVRSANNVVQYGVVTPGEKPNADLLARLTPAGYAAVAGVDKLPDELRHLARLVAALGTNLYGLVYCPSFRHGDHRVRATLAVGG